MNSVHRWILAIVVVLAWSAVAGDGGPTEDEAARDVDADVVQAQVDARAAKKE
jgi:hypothetical protein